MTPAKKNKILIVDDEPDILEFISYNLKKEGYEVLSAPDGMQGIKIAREEKPDLIILDVMMPKMDGMQVCHHLRQQPETKTTLIVFLTALSDENSEIRGLNTGADDFIVKPIKPAVLMSRVKAILRRLKTDTHSRIIQLGTMQIDLEKFLVKEKNTEHLLPRKEFELLWLLAGKPGRVFQRQEILSKVWGDDVIVGDRTIDVHIRKLRQRFGDDLIKTIKGVGYKLEI